MAKQHSSSTPDEHDHHNESAFVPPVEADEEHFGEVTSNDFVAKAATIVVVGVGAAIISAELIPGMLLGVAAALLPGMGPKMRPMLKSTVKAGYSAVRKTREMMAEASEQVRDMMMEAKAEDVPSVPRPPAAAATNSSAASSVKAQG